MANLGYEISFYKIIPDERRDIEKELIYLADELKVNLILTNGGTGFAKRDVTPEATKSVIEKDVPGISEVMRMNSVKINSHAMLSRGVSGIRKDSLIINLPGSTKAAIESLEFVLPAIPHGIDILNGYSLNSSYIHS